MSQHHRRRFLNTLAERQNHRCCYCGVRFVDIENHPDSASQEHIIPKSNIKIEDSKNKVCACRGCNNKRGNMDILEFLTKMGIPCDIDILAYVRGKYYENEHA